ncbi:hypothetical protein D9619_003650 [Psilocybe cf. subviscida]|uniref:Phosphoribulokinase/uridine kinase domain-containing protein n=1 Tax=Psilocybe cf. subviscida TaxID=2480587 RepID=A0A8H5EUX0_9AGAR|nr:hypothetical protein D9619_003650 [Psilocybe cf. subviscida]
MEEMDTEIEELAQVLVHRLDSTPPHLRLLIGIAGIPASGKSTFAKFLTDRVNSLLREQGLERPRESSAGLPTHAQPRHTKSERAILVGLDGWHLTRAQLDAFPDPKLAHDRRGIHWTFDGESYVNFVRQLRGPITSTMDVIRAPSFDHALKDPTPDAVLIQPYHRVVIVEGLYAFLSITPWKEAGALLDERWYIKVDPVEARRRLVVRHVLTGVAKDMKEAEWRADENDGPNGLFIIENLLEPTRTITSTELPVSLLD